MKWLFFLCFISTNAIGAELTGSVTRKGLGRNVVVTLASEDKTFLLCPNDLTKGIAKLARMMVRVAGDWTGDSKCFVTKDFEVLELVSGARAITGILLQKNGAYSIKGKNESFPISRPNKGLLEMLNKKVIIEIHAATNKKGELSYRIGSYMEYPEI